ncbi:MAG: hypothetical protein ACYSWO_08725 [Planctomycetota bacterium]|jgi:hypothetical protein
MLRQLYLPYENFRQSITCYSGILLLDTLKLMRKARSHIVGNYRSANDDGVAQLGFEWRGHYDAYAKFNYFCYLEAERRGLQISSTYMAESKAEAARYRRWTKPHWVGWAQRHASHRANLLVLGAAETVLVRYAQWKGCSARGNIVSRFISTLFPYASWHNLSLSNIELLHNHLDQLECPRYYGNHYEQFGWDEEPDNNIILVPQSQEYYAC